MVEPQEGFGGTPPSPPPEPAFRERLAYLHLFSEALLDLIPDGVAVLDAGLRVRAANRGFARLLGEEDPRAARGADARALPLLAAPLPGREGKTLARLLEELAETGEEAAFEDLRPPGPEGKEAPWSVRAAGWDAEDPSYRRVLLWVRPPGGAPGGSGALPGPLLEEKNETIFALTARQERLLDLVPAGVCVLDPALRLRAMNRRAAELLGRPFRPAPGADRHLFAQLPELRDEDFLERLERCRDSADSVRGILSVTRSDGSPLEVEVEILPVAGPDRHVGELLVLIHEVRGMSPTSAARSESPPRFACGSQEILAPEHLERWPPPATRRILLVEADPWARMLLSDTLRARGYDDVTLAESGQEALARHDPGAFGAVIVGLDADRDDAVAVCRRLAEEFPRTAVLALTEGAADAARAALGEVGGFGLLAAARPEEIAEVVDALFRGRPDSAPAGRGEPPHPRRWDVIVLGAQDPDVAVLRLLYRVERMNIRMVYDPDPKAFGLSLAQNLGIPALSGELTMKLERPPDAVILAREDLSGHLAALDLEAVPCITRDELELFLADPESFLEADPSAASAAAGPPAGEASAAPEEPPEARGPSGGESPVVEGEAGGLREEEAPAPPSGSGPREAAPAEPAAPREETAPAEPPEREEPPPATLGAQALPSAPDAPHPVEGARVVSLGPDAEEEGDEDAAAGPADEVEALLRALDLLLDFDRFAARVLEMALEISGGTSGSLMVLHDDTRELRIAASRGLSDLVIQQTRQRVGEGVAGRVAEDGEPLLLLGTIGDERFKRKRERPEIRSSVCVPVVADGRVVGVISVNSDPGSTPFDREVLRQVARLGRQVGGALDRSRQLRRMRGRSFELSVRAEIEAIASSRDDPVTRLRRIACRVAEMLNLDACSIYLLDTKRQELVLRALAGARAAAMDAISLPIGSGLVGWVARNLKPLILRNAAEDPAEESAEALTWVGIPIRYHTDLVGVMAIESTARVPLDEERLDLLASVAAVVGQEIGGVRAHEDSERKVTMLSALSELGLAFGAVPERGGLAKLVTFSACTVLESDVATLRLLAPGASPATREVEHFQLLGAHGASVAGPGDPLVELEERIAREVALTRQPCRDTDLPVSDVEPLLERSNVSATLGVPVLCGNDLLGILIVYRVVDARGAAHPYRDEEVEIAVRLADYAAAAVQRFVEERDGRGATPGA